MIRGILIWGVSISVWGLLLIGYVLRGGSTLLFMLIIASFILVQGALVQLGGPRRVQLQRILSPQRPTVGEELVVELSITVGGGFVPFWMQVEDILHRNPHPLVNRTRKSTGTPLHQTTTRTTLHKSPHNVSMLANIWRVFTVNRHYGFTYKLPGLTRGIYSGWSTVVTWGDPLGWFRRSIQIEMGDTLVVLPTSTSGLSSGQMHANDDSEEQEQSIWRLFPTRVRLDNSLLRSYQIGDPWKLIHWKSSARTGELLTRMPEEGRRASHCILLDTHYASYSSLIRRNRGEDGALERFEHAISCAAYLIRMEAAIGHEVVLVYGGQDKESYTAREGTTAEMLTCLAGIEWTDGANSEVSVLLKETIQANPDLCITVITGCLTAELTSVAATAASRGMALQFLCVKNQGTLLIDDGSVDQRVAFLRERGVSVVWVPTLVPVAVPENVDLDSPSSGEGRDDASA